MLSRPLDRHRCRQYGSGRCNLSSTPDIHDGDTTPEVPSSPAVWLTAPPSSKPTGAAGKEPHRCPLRGVPGPPQRTPTDSRDSPGPCQLVAGPCFAPPPQQPVSPDYHDCPRPHRTLGFAHPPGRLRRMSLGPCRGPDGRADALPQKPKNLRLNCGLTSPGQPSPPR